MYLHYDHGKMRRYRPAAQICPVSSKTRRLGGENRGCLFSSSACSSFSSSASVSLLPSRPSWWPSLYPPLPLPPSDIHSESLQSYWPWFLLICIRHFSFFGIWRWGTFPSLSEFTAISLCVFSKGLAYEMHIKYPLIPHYPTDKITMIMRQKF